MADAAAAAHIGRQSDPAAYLRRVLGAFLEPPVFLTLPQLLGAEMAVREMPPLPVSTPPPAKGFRAAEHAAEVEVLVDATADEAPQGDVADFIRYFNDRYDTLAKLLRRRREVANAIPISRALSAGKEIQLIGMVDDVSKSNKSGHRFLEIEDQSGSATILIPAGKPELITEADALLKDEVVGVVARTTKEGNLLVADAIIRPELPFRADTRSPLEIPLHVAFLGDIHLGSKTFLGPAFRRLMRWFRGEEGDARERALAQSIKYVVLPGDIVDGVGIYPGQEEGLDILDILEQYRRLAAELEQLPRHLHLVILPGNHDASRPTEPQPAFDKEIRGYFDALNTTFVSNPSTFALHGRRILGYHGFSMVDFATHVPGLSLERPTDIMKQMLRSRHVAPTFGGTTPLAPDRHDRLLIGLEPDIFATGHVHVAGIDRMNGVTLVNGGTWQSQTDYQRMHNLVPTPALMPVVNLSTFAAMKVDFSAGP